MTRFSLPTAFHTSLAGLALLAAASFTGCSHVYVEQSFTDPGFTTETVKNAKSMLVVSPDVSVREFKQSFEWSYGTGDSLAHYLSARIADSLSTAGIDVTQGKGMASLATLEGNSLNPDAIAKAQADLKAVSSAYLLYVKNVTVSNSITSTGPMMMAAPGGGMMMGGGGSSETCWVSYDVDIWEPATLKKLAAVHVSGSSSVFMFAYQTALNSAVDASALHLVRYLQKNQTEFY